MWKWGLFMILINLLHPNIFFDQSSWNIKSYNSMIEDNVTYTINDVMAVFSASRLIPVFIYIFKSVKFNSAKAERVW
jgi:hypothetical protein